MYKDFVKPSKVYNYGTKFKKSFDQVLFDYYILSISYCFTCS